MESVRQSSQSVVCSKSLTCLKGDQPIGTSRMPYFTYDLDATRLLFAALSDALGTVRKVNGGVLTEVEMLDFSERIVPNLIDVFVLGERDPLALKIAGLHGLLVSRVDAAQAKAYSVSEGL